MGQSGDSAASRAETRWDSGLKAAFERRIEDRPSVIDRLQGDQRPAVALDTAALGATRRLDLREEIARGGVGVILAAHDRDLGRTVAVKVLREQYADSGELTRRFVEEAQIGAQLQHPGIVPVYDLGLDERQRPFFSMKLVRGRSLAEILAHRQSSDAERHRLLTIFLQVCQTIAYAHSRGVVHRDLKPANVMVGSFGEVQVMDWGFAKILAREEPESDSLRTVRSSGGADSLPGATLGTPSYMAPEQARGDVRSIDERTDVFALGAILLEILAGRPPYEGDAAMDAAKAADLAPAHGAIRAARVDSALEAIVLSCLSVEADGRPKDAAAVAEAISRYLDAVDERARTAELVAARAESRLHAERKARRTTLALAGALLVMAVLAVSFFWWRAIDQERVAGELRHTLDSVSRLEERGELRAALQMALRAEGLVGVTAAGSGKLEEVRALRARLERAIDEEQITRRLRRLRIDPASGPRALDEYERFFRRNGIVAPRARPPEIAAAVAVYREPVAQAIARGLENWALRLIAADRDRWRSLLTAASAIDRDALRGRVRAALRDHAVSKLFEIALEVDQAPAATCCLLAEALALEGEIGAAISVLERAATRHRDFWVHYRLAYLYLDTDPPRPDDADRHGELARALHEDPDWRPFPGRRR